MTTARGGEPREAAAGPGERLRGAAAPIDDPLERRRAPVELDPGDFARIGHPRFFGYITAGPAPLGILADLLASAVNPNVGGWPLSPMASEMEAQAVRWIAELVGFPPRGGGLLTSGGNVANMLAFWAARARVQGWDVRRDGLRAEGSRSLRVYGSAGMHTWIEKAADLAGLGTSSIRWIETDPRGAIDLEALRHAIVADVSAGDLPLIVVGTAGSVGTGVVDPLPELRAVCDEHGIWFHVDGAYGAFAAAAPNAPDDLRGLALADLLPILRSGRRRLRSRTT